MKPKQKKVYIFWIEATQEQTISNIKNYNPYSKTIKLWNTDKTIGLYKKCYQTLNTENPKKKLLF